MRRKLICVILAVTFTALCACSSDVTTEHETSPAEPSREIIITEQPKPSQTPIVSASPEATPPVISGELSPQRYDYYGSLEYFFIVSEIISQEFDFLFGENAIHEMPQYFIEKFGEPIEKRLHEESHVQDADVDGTWLFSQGFEIDVSTQNDTPIINNYVHLLPTCELTLSTGIGIGSTRDEVYDAYGEVINYDRTDDVRIAIGTRFWFVMSDDVVQSIHISTDCLEEAYWDYVPE